jgi:hypothetical protein
MRNVVASAVFLALAGCASHRAGRDPLCQEIAAFANATKPGEIHVVSLETAWGSSNTHPDSLASRDCSSGGYEPGARLCRYLVQHSFTEFSHENFRSSLACLSNVPLQTKNYVTYERLDARVSAYGAAGVRENVEVWLEFKPNTIHGTVQLDIGAKALKTPE